jgi:hypothetical protein
VVGKDLVDALADGDETLEIWPEVGKINVAQQDGRVESVGGVTARAAAVLDLEIEKFVVGDLVVDKAAVG